MLTIIIIILLVLGFFAGYRRGIVMQAIRLIGYLVTFVLATQFFEPLTGLVEMFVPFPSVQPNTELIFYDEATSFLIDSAFYRVITFILIAIIGWLLTNFISMFFMKVMYYDWQVHLDRIGGGIINLIITYVIIFLFLFILSLLPIEFIQQQFVDNPIAYHIVANTPWLSNFAAETWLTVNPF